MAFSIFGVAFGHGIYHSKRSKLGEPVNDTVPRGRMHTKAPICRAVFISPSQQVHIDSELLALRGQPRGITQWQSSELHLSSTCQALG